MPWLSRDGIIIWMVKKVCTDIHGAQRINPSALGDHLTFQLAPPEAQSFHLFNEISKDILHIYWTCQFLEMFLFIYFYTYLLGPIYVFISQ